MQPVVVWFDKESLNFIKNAHFSHKTGQFEGFYMACFLL
jgi:hypothetical protein